jgi:hypothetical protein
LHYLNTHIKNWQILQFKPIFPTPVNRTADMFINITYLISYNDPGLQVQYRMTHYISGWRNGGGQTFAKGIFFLTKCSRGFRSVRLLVRRQLSSAASLSSSLLSCSKRVAGANSVNICCLSKTFQELQHLPTLLLDKLGNL